MNEKGWWRANAVWVGILVFLLPAGALFIVWREGSAVGTNPLGSGSYVSAPSDEPLEFANATWGPIRAGVIDDTFGLTPPPGTKVIGVAIPVTPDPADPVHCDAPVLIQQSTGIQWNEMSYELEFDAGIGGDLYCDFEATEPYEIVVPFAVPEDVEGPFWVDVAPSEEVLFGDGSVEIEDTGIDGRSVRFSIDP